ncbi:RNA polymerase sigma factor [Larkinella soli]|uniref:RNA polymerase sigma factor n=1 Tax=Larkinella soli TaxID=1770527 RepID=UPI000FFC1E05|nr:sigma-70 family RNA polymerase sigma factor [Larkinella soli]
MWEDFRQGDRGAFSTMYEKYAGVLYNYGYKIAQDRQLTEDCIQDVFVTLLEYRQRLAPTDSIKFYLFKALRREILRKLRQQNRFASEDEIDFRATFVYEDSWLDGQLSRERVGELLQALNQLPARQKEAIFLKYFDGLSYAEVAGVMGIEPSSAYKIIYKALDKLQKLLTFQLVLLLLSGRIG